MDLVNPQQSIALKVPEEVWQIILYHLCGTCSYLPTSQMEIYPVEYPDAIRSQTRAKQQGFFSLKKTCRILYRHCKVFHIRCPLLIVPYALKNANIVNQLPVPNLCYVKRVKFNETNWSNKSVNTFTNMCCVAHNLESIDVSVTRPSRVKGYYRDELNDLLSIVTSNSETLIHFRWHDWLVDAVQFYRILPYERIQYLSLTIDDDDRPPLRFDPQPRYKAWTVLKWFHIRHIHRTDTYYSRLHGITDDDKFPALEEFWYTGHEWDHHVYNIVNRAPNLKSLALKCETNASPLPQGPIIRPFNTKLHTLMLSDNLLSQFMEIDYPMLEVIGLLDYNIKRLISAEDVDAIHARLDNMWSALDNILERTGSINVKHVMLVHTLSDAWSTVSWNEETVDESCIRDAVQQLELQGITLIDRDKKPLERPFLTSSVAETNPINV